VNIIPATKLWQNACKENPVKIYGSGINSTSYWDPQLDFEKLFSPSKYFYKGFCLWRNLKLTHIDLKYILKKFSYDEEIMRLCLYKEFPWARTTQKYDFKLIEK
jgi:hypothetical protein